MYGGNEMSLVYENRVFNRRSGLTGSRMGCTLVTGFLGSGKTTLLKHILDNRGDLRLAVLVNEFADSDVDSLLLDSTHLNAAFNLSTVSLTHGCGCCDVSGPFRESLQRIVDSKHNFDCLLIETSGLAKPEKFVAELEEVGINLDWIIAVVDAESLPKILSMDVVKQQLQHVDLVLLNKCDLATLSQISDAEDILEGLTGGAKVIRSQFCKVPLELVIDFSKSEPQPVPKADISGPAFLSHEPLPKTTFQAATFGNTSVGISSSDHAEGQSSTSRKSWTSDDLQSGLSHGESFSSLTFESEVPLSLASFQSIILTKMRCMNGLLRAKGILWLAEDRESRFVFQWSGVKRVEAVSGGPWESPPKTCLVLIGTDRSELEAIYGQLSKSADPQKEIASYIRGSKESAKILALKIAKDGRFKVSWNSSLDNYCFSCLFLWIPRIQTPFNVPVWIPTFGPLYAKQEPYLQKEPLMVFGLKGSPLHGIKESQLNGSLLRIVNGKGKIFLTATTSGQDYNLQLLLDDDSNIDEAWDEIRVAAGVVISKLCKNFCPCRSDLTAHVH